MKILIPLDGSRFAEAVLEPAVELARRTDAEVHLLEVLKPSKLQATWVHTPSADLSMSGRRTVARSDASDWPSPADGLGMPAETKGQAAERVEHQTREYLANIARQYFPQGAIRELAVREDVAEAILDYARNHEIDLIAMATHGRTGLARLVMGSVASHLVSSGVAPLYLVRPDKLHTREEELEQV